jgi:parvulin-like peptidyl-prolyl isomerase
MTKKYVKGVDKIYFKKDLWFFFLGFLLVFTPSCGNDAKLFNRDKVIARVDNTQITERDLVKYYRTLVPSSIEEAGTAPVSMDLKKSLLERLIYDRLLMLQAAKTGITVNDEEVDQLYAGIAKDYGKDFKGFLKRFHLTPEEWKKALRRNLLIDKVIKRHMRTVNDVSKEEIRAYYQAHLDEFKIPMQYHIFQIVVPTRKLAVQLINKLKKRQSFQSIAKKFSIFPEGKRGGDMGYWREDHLPAEFEIVRQMRVGEISKILHSPYGYHIIMLTEIKEARQLSLKEAGPQIARKLLSKRRESEKELWFKKLKGKAHIVVYMRVLESITFN